MALSPFNDRLQRAKKQEEVFNLMLQLHVRCFVVPDRLVSRANITPQLPDFLAHYTSPMRLRPDDLAIRYRNQIQSSGEYACRSNCHWSCDGGGVPVAVSGAPADARLNAGAAAPEMTNVTGTVIDRSLVLYSMKLSSPV